MFSRIVIRCVLLLPVKHPRQTSLLPLKLNHRQLPMASTSIACNLIPYDRYLTCPPPENPTRANPFVHLPDARSSTYRNLRASPSAVLALINEVPSWYLTEVGPPIHVLVSYLSLLKLCLNFIFGSFYHE